MSFIHDLSLYKSSDCELLSSPEQITCALKYQCTERASHFVAATWTTVMRRLMTRIRSEKCIVKQFRRRSNITECTYTNLDRIVYYTPSLYSIAYCS